MEFNELIRSIDIVEYISQYIDLQKRGDEWWGLSCFKDEKTPSFSVRQNPPFFYDYSSGQGGNLFVFVKLFHNCSNNEAAKIIMDYAGCDQTKIDLKRFKLPATIDCKKYKKGCNTKSVYTNITKLPPNVMDKYERRPDKLQLWEREGISRETMSKFCVRYDSFSNRIVYPIKDDEGTIVNIGGRALDVDWKEKGQRKYTYFHNWGSMNVLYGLYENMRAIKDRQEIIIFEGCKSVLIADTWHIQNSVALLTSHLNQNQMKKLAKLGCRVVFALDNDINIRNDKHIATLKKFVNVEYLYDFKGLLGEKDSPVDKGYDVFCKLYNTRYKYR